MNQNELLPWHFVTGHPSRREFARHVRSLPKQYRREAVARLAAIAWPGKAWPELRAKVAALLASPRVQRCTEMENVSLAHTATSAALNPSCTNSAIRFLKAVEADREWNPNAWNQ